VNRLLVTGGAGFIGSCFVRQVLRSPETQVVVLDKLTYAGHLENLSEVRDHPGFHFCHGDIADDVLTRRLLAEHQPQAVVNFAAESHVDRSIDDPLSFVSTNVVGTCRLLESCLDYFRQLPVGQQPSFRFLQVSTDEVFGALGAAGNFDATSPYAPNSPYAASKAAADHFVRAYHRTYGLPTLVTHCGNNYGPYQFPEKLIPLIILRAVAGQTLPVYGNGAHVRDWIHVVDHCAGLQLALERGIPGQPYAFGGDGERSNLEVVGTICRILDQLVPPADGVPRESRITLVADRPGHDFRYAIDAAETSRQLGWRPARDFETGLTETVRWYLAHDDWVECVRAAAYDERRIGLRDAGKWGVK
jgi:dTDP-glucose 4,6-dehydratase